jgi:hypothetical protein
MTEQEIQDLPIEKIIHLPNFQRLESRGGVDEYSTYEELHPVQTPHWEITFKAKKLGHGAWECFGRKIPFPHYRIYKFKDLPQQTESNE